MQTAAKPARTSQVPSSSTTIAWRLCLFALLTIGTFAQAQTAVEEEDSAQAEPLPEAILEDMRAPQITGDFCLIFELEHRPQDRKLPRQHYVGQLMGSQAYGSARYRLTLLDHPHYSSGRSSIKGQALLLLAGEDSQAFRVPLTFKFQQFTHPEEWQRGPLQPLTGEALFEPLMPDFVYTPFELQMPFLYWREWKYLGKERAKGRTVHVFDMLPPASTASANPQLSAVRIYVDHKFSALLKAELLDPQQMPVKTFKINKIKKVQERYIVREIDLFDEVTRDKTRFTVTAAATGLSLPPETFSQDDLLQAEPTVAPEKFENLD